MDLVVPNAYEGSLCEIRSPQNTLIALGKIKEVRGNIITIASKNEDFLPMSTNYEVLINIINTKYGFLSFIAKVYTSSRLEITISNFKLVTDSERRKNFRVDMNVRVKVRFEKNLIGKRFGEAEITIKDMSMTGIRFDCSEKFSRDTIISFQMDIGRREPVFLQYKIIRFIGETKYFASFGCQLEGQPNNDLISYLFKKQAELIGKNRK